MIRKEKPSKRAIGKNWEETAEQFLRAKGFEIIERNYVYNHGEIDLIAKENEEIVFIEVKFRNNARFGLPEEFVTPKKQERIRRTAEGFAAERNITNISCRFDVVSIHMEKGKPTITHLRNAF
ncbi:MAG: YraN family protein [Bacteroidetes bacterium]|nr:YraN family protein [Bacteroidota bacterium]